MKLRDALFKLISIVIGFFIAFGIAELAVRLIAPQRTGPVEFALDPVLGDIMAPGQHGRQTLPGNYSFTYHNNSLGFRGSREYGEQKNGRRVLLLGDSFTYGTGVNDDQTFAFLAEQELAAQNRQVEILNAGCAGKGTDYALKLFLTLGNKLKPDLTALCFFGNDFVDNARGEYYRIGENGELVAKPAGRDRSFFKKALFHVPGYNWLISWSQAANLAKQAGVAWVMGQNQVRDAGGGKLVISYSYDGRGYADDQNRRDSAVYLEKLRQAVKSSGSGFLLFFLPNEPELQQYRKNGELSHDERALREIADSQGVTVYSLTPVLAASGQSIRQLYYPEGHWTAAAHRLAGHFVAGQLRQALEQKGGLEESPLSRK